jgi:hypothetical protein
VVAVVVNLGLLVLAVVEELVVIYLIPLFAQSGLIQLR